MAEFKVGDKVLHPIYGAGKLVSIEKRGRDGTASRYYVIELVQGKGRLLTPVEKSEELGLSPEALRIAHDSAGRVSIPMSGSRRSLNVAVAFGILLQRWHSQLVESGGDRAGRSG